jgi:predicted ArsR family transcriptional regulator
MNGLARYTDPSTSHDAAESIDTTQLERMVFNVLKEYGPQTSEQVAEKLKMPLVSISPRFRPLANKGKIIDSGERFKNKSGRCAILWAVSGVNG